MAFLTASELSDMRRHLNATLPDTCAIYYVTRTSDGMGGVTEAWTARGTAIACRLSPARVGSQSGITQETVMEGQVWNLSVAHNQTVALDDKVTVSSDTYRVTQVNTNESELGMTRVYLVRWS